MQALPTLSHDNLVHVHKAVKDLREVLNLAPPIQGSPGLGPNDVVLATEIASIEHAMKTKKRNRLGTMQCEQCGEPLATSPAVRRGPSGSKSLCTSNVSGVKWPEERANCTEVNRHTIKKGWRI
jgi:hypothetical protein